MSSWPRRFPKSRTAMHLDTVFTMCDRDLVNVYQRGVDEDRGRFSVLFRQPSPVMVEVVPGTTKPFLEVVQGDPSA